MSDRPLFVGPLLHLRTLPAFAALSHEQLASLAHETEEVVIQRGTTLVSAEDFTSAIYLVVDGQVQVTTAEGRASVGPGGTIGFLEALSSSPDPLAARAETDVVAFRLEMDALRDICEQNFAVLHALLSYAAGRVADFPEALLPSVSGKAGAPPGPVPDPSEADLDRVARILALHRAPAFPSASMDALAELAAAADPLRLDTGETLWTQGAASTGFFVLYSGRMELAGPGWGSPSECGPGAVPGFVLMLADRRLSYDARALEPCTVLFIGAEQFFDVLEDHFEMAFGLLALLAGRLLTRRDGGSARGADEGSAHGSDEGSARGADEGSAHGADEESARGATEAEDL